MEVSDAVTDVLRKLVGLPIQASDTGRTGEMNRRKAADPVAYDISILNDPCVTRDDVAVANSSLKDDHSLDGEPSCSKCVHLTWGMSR